MPSTVTPYEFPNVVQILEISLSLIALRIANLTFTKFTGAGLIGEILVGLILGTPVLGFIAPWQDTVTILGGLGITMIVFEGGLTIDYRNLSGPLLRATAIALTGILVPIGLSMLLLSLAFEFSILSSFGAGAALASTSLGSTFVILSSVSENTSKTGRILMLAALIDDIIGIVLIGIITKLASSSSGLAWAIGRPIVASIASIAVALLMAYPIRFIIQVQRFRPIVLILMLGYALGFSTAVSYAGSTQLLGDFLAGMTFTCLPSFDASEIYSSRLGSLQSLLSSFFFASIGYSIPLTSLFDRQVVWKGFVYAALMVIGKLVCGAWMFVLAQEQTIRDAVLVSWAMVTRGEIGLLLAGLGRSSGVLSEDAFAIVIWAIVLCTLSGPIGVGFTLRKPKREKDTSQEPCPVELTEWTVPAIRASTV